MLRPRRSSRVPRLAAGSCAGAVLACAFVALLGAGRPDSGPAGSIAPWFPSGPPAPAFLATLPGDVQVDNFGDAWVTRGSGRPHVLVLAHRDAPGYVVSQILPDGYLRLQRLGTPASPLFDQFEVGKRLVVCTARGPLPAVAMTPSTHFRRGSNVPVPEATVDDLWIDVGAESADEARAMGIALLDPVTPSDPAAGALGAALAKPDGIVRGPAAGVRAACALVAAAVGTPARGTLTCAWVSGGTEGGRGSRRLLATLGPVDSVLVVEPAAIADADSLSRVPALVGRGPWIAAGDTTREASRAWAEAMRSKMANLALGPIGASSADARALSAAGTPTLVYQVPVAYAGSPGEMVEFHDALGKFVVLLGQVSPSHGADAASAGGLAAVAGTGATWGAAFARAPGHVAAWGAIAPLLSAYGVSEHESAVAAAVKAALPEGAAQSAIVDERGNVELRLGDGPPRRLFVAHMDEIGYRVTGHDADGRAHVVREGGFYDWLYEGETVRIAPPEGPAGLGVVAPRAGSRGGPRPAVLDPLSDVVHGPVAAASKFDVADVRLDGYPTAPIPGSDVTVLHELARLGAHRFAARAIDDRFGDAALVLAARELWPERHHLPNTVWLVWSVEEEIGLKGAQWLADSLAHHGALPVRVHAVDTFVSSDSPLEDPRIGGARLGHGAVIRAVDTSHEAPLPAVRATLALAAREDVPLQYGVTAGGNDGVPFAEHGSINVPLGWPLRSSHSAVEVADLRDLESLARLVKVLAEQPARDDARLP